MDVNERDHFVEDLLDASLKQFRGDEPRPGLEGRILASVRAREHAEQRRRFWTWALGAAASLVLVAVVLSWPRHHPLPVSGPSTSPAPQPATKPGTPPPTTIAPQAVSTAPKTDRHGPRVALATRRPQQFPTPMPLTKQEQLLLLYVKSLNRSGVVVATNPSQKDEELKIPELSIAALDPIRPLSGSEERTEN